MSRDLPDIVLVVFDTARWDRFGCYGYGRPTTPTVDALASDGLRVDTMVANGPWTLPSHGSLFTGLYPSQHGSQWQTGPRMRADVPITLAEWLRGLGYATICATNNGLISTKTGLARGFDRYAFRLDLERGLPRVARRLRKVVAGGDSGGKIVNRWIRRELSGVRQPTFLFVNYLECHWAYVPPERLVRRVGGPRFTPIAGARYRADLARRAGPWEAVARADERLLEIYSTLYDAELANTDAHFAELLDILKKTGHLRDDRTVVIVTSDHGEHIGEHGLADHHASLDEHLVRVPFVAWGPGTIRPAVRTDLFELVDVFPSLCRLLGRDLPAPHLGERRTDLFQANGASGRREYAFAEWRAWTEGELARLSRRNPSYDFSRLPGDLVAVRDRRFKMVRSSDGTEALYDLVEDPQERTDVAGSRPDVVGRLRTQLDSETGAWEAWANGDAVISAHERMEIEQRLEELGYI